jgi:hypothetical protein
MLLFVLGNYRIQIQAIQVNVPEYKSSKSRDYVQREKDMKVTAM